MLHFEATLRGGESSIPIVLRQEGGAGLAEIALNEVSPLWSLQARSTYFFKLSADGSEPPIKGVTAAAPLNLFIVTSKPT